MNNKSERRLTLFVDPLVKHALKIRAAEDRDNPSHIVERLIREYVKQKPKKSRSNGAAG